MKKFYTPFQPSIYYNDEARVSNHNEIKQWVLDMYAQSPAKDDGNFYHTGFTTYFYKDFTSHLDELDIFKELKEIILREAEAYVANSYVQLRSNGVQVPPPRPLTFANMWFNVNPPGGYQGKHHHSMNLLGGTYYIDVPEDSGNIAFYDPNPFAYLHNQDPPAMHMIIPDFKVVTREGDLLIWPGWMDHEISVNKTKDKNRITISFGINWGFEPR